MNEKKCVSLQMNKSTSFPYIPLIVKLMVRELDEARLLYLQVL